MTTEATTTAPSFEIDGNHFGEVSNLREGSKFENRKELHNAGVHRGLMRGIAPMGASIVLSGGYADDEDHGDLIIYTGEGGRDPNSGLQIRDQELTLGNLALARNSERGWPVRVIVGHQHDPTVGSGYRYDGLYRVASYWSERGRHGFLIWRFRMEKIVEKATLDGNSKIVQSPSSPGPVPRERTMVSRVIRNTRIGDAVKDMHDFTCQVCASRIETPAGPYAEGAHIRPLGRPHDGPDIIENVLCLCPNCHVRFDTLAIWVDLDFLVQPVGTPLRRLATHAIDADHIRYHRSLCGQ